MQMGHRGYWLSVVLAVSALTTQCKAVRRISTQTQTTTNGTADPSWYDATALLPALRPEIRANAAQLAGLSRLDDLPLYDLTVGVDLTSKTFTLREQVWFTNTLGRPLDEIVFRLYANVAGNGTAAATTPVTFDTGSCEGNTQCTVTAERPSVVSVRLAQPLAQGARVRIAMNLHGTLEAIDNSRTNVLSQGIESLTMLGASEPHGDYGLLAIGDNIGSLANFYPVLARERAGRWEREEPSAIGDLGSDELAHVRAHIEVPANVTVATTGSTISETPQPNGNKRVEVVSALVRDFALLASPDLVMASRNVGGVEVRSFFLAPERSSGEKVLDTAEHALQVYERRFGRYPYAELDLVESALVGGAGGVEFAGLVTIASMMYRSPIPTSGVLSGLSGLLGATPGSPGAASMTAMMGSMLEFVTAHEVAHQYWHGLVGSDSRLHPYVDESLAQWSAELYLEERYGAAHARREGDLNIGMNYQAMRLLGHNDGAVDRPVEAFGGALPYAGLVYGKGPYLYRALRQQVGDPVFFAALQSYVQRYQFRLAPARGFLDVLSATPGADPARVQSLARRWLEENHGDEDLGQPSWTNLLATALSAGVGSAGGLPGAGAGGSAPGAPPELQQLLQLFNQLNGGTPPPSGSPGSPSPGGNQNPEQMLRDMLQQLGGPT